MCVCKYTYLYLKMTLNLRYFQTEEITVVCDILKVLFNLYIHSDDTGIEDQEKYRNLVLILYKLLVFKYSLQQDDLERKNMLVIQCNDYRVLQEKLYLIFIILFQQCHQLIDCNTI